LADHELLVGAAVQLAGEDAVQHPVVQPDRPLDAVDVEHDEHPLALLRESLAEPHERAGDLVAVLVVVPVPPGRVVPLVAACRLRRGCSPCSGRFAETRVSWAASPPPAARAGCRARRVLAASGPPAGRARRRPSGPPASTGRTRPRRSGPRT